MVVIILLNELKKYPRLTMNKCLECKKELTKADKETSLDLFGIDLCSKHGSIMENLVKRHKTPREAIQLYYALKKAGASPMLEWWDGNKSVDIALSRVRLNLEIEMEYKMFTSDQVLATLEERGYAYNDGFITLRIPHMLIRQWQSETVAAILGIMEGIRARSKAV